MTTETFAERLKELMTESSTTDYLLGRTDKPDDDIGFLGIKRLVARGSSTMTHEEKMELINIIFGKE